MTCVGLHSERDKQLQTSALADSTELRYTEYKFILNGFPSGFDGCLFFFFFLNRVTNSYFDKRIPLENNKLIIYSDYEVAVVCNSISGRSVRTVIETNKFSCRWQPCCILVLLHCSLFSKTVNRQPQKNKRTTLYILIRQKYQAYARTCNFLTHTFFLFAIACYFWRVLFSFFRLTYTRGVM